VDLDAGTLTVTGTVIRERGRGLLIQDVPKTTAGRRTIALHHGQPSCSSAASPF
jgi:hypothetical protein